MQAQGLQGSNRDYNCPTCEIICLQFVDVAGLSNVFDTHWIPSEMRFRRFSKIIGKVWISCPISARVACARFWDFFGSTGSVLFTFIHSSHEDSPELLADHRLSCVLRSRQNHACPGWVAQSLIGDCFAKKRQKDPRQLRNSVPNSVSLCLFAEIPPISSLWIGNPNRTPVIACWPVDR